VGVVRRRRRGAGRHRRRVDVRGTTQVRNLQPVAGAIRSSDEGEYPMDSESQVIRQQMQQTRTALSEKVERLEQEVVQTVHEATEAVNDTVASIKEAAQQTVNTVKDTVHDTVQTVRETLDVPTQVRRHPWAMLAGSVAVGFLGGLALNR